MSSLIELSRALSLAALAAAAVAQREAVPTPEEYFGFRLGTDGELAAYPEVLAYMQLLADRTDRVTYEELGRTTMGCIRP